MEINKLNQLLGNIDIYLLDQILKGRFTKEMKILDAGCGEGRNCIYFLNQGYQIFGVDANPIAVQMARIYAQTIQPDYDIFRFQTATVQDMPFHKGAFDAIISSAVLHFANGEAHFFKMMDEMMKVLKVGGTFFLRMTTGFGGIQDISPNLGDGVYVLPDGSERFILTKELMEKIQLKYGLTNLEAPKSVLVHDQRAMGVFVWKKAKN
ncbi:class I SAM-dependent methyltransferase [Belliella sp. DSM 107340]|uniref:Class I SAM-dependent methyltransferase n=1 Tax=Belliella calami TaxID=2923436 RepID=A0ABS9UMK8_9BACT|nr:class I SAM-dependent methyltransferase [Belliella calami]MCH7397435.1 class I SAM-dependent methyltransferase [Belliella calami]